MTSRTDSTEQTHHAVKGRKSANRARRPHLAKVPSGIRGLDEITAGGLPKDRTTLLCGGPGCGKTIFALEFLARGAIDHGETGVFMSFEESEKELAANVGSLGFDLDDLQRQKLIFVDHVHVERSEIEETGDYDLEGLFVRLEHAIQAVGAKRVVLDTVDSLFSTLPNPSVLRSELRRLFRWLKDRKVTSIVTVEKSDSGLLRHRLEEYVSDCVIFLDHRVNEQISTRRMRIVKYRGTTHGTNEYPFLIGENGISVLPITSLHLDHVVVNERVTTGVARLDEMLGGKGYYRGSSVLISGTAGTGKTSVAAHFAEATCAAGGRCIFFTFEEPASQLLRNMHSIGIDLDTHQKRGRLEILAAMPQTLGLELHLVEMYNAIDRLEPTAVVIDPITNLTNSGTLVDARSMITRLIDMLKRKGITAVLTSLTANPDDLEDSEVGISSLIDTWLLLEITKLGGERNRTLSIVKSRGMAHSNQSAEFVLTNQGIELVETYLGANTVLTGSARLIREAEEADQRQAFEEKILEKEALRNALRKKFERQIESLREEFALDDKVIAREIQNFARSRERMVQGRESIAKSRKAFRPVGDGGTARAATSGKRGKRDAWTEEAKQ